MKRFAFSFLAMGLALVTTLVLQVATAQTFPNTNPPGGNIVPTFSGLNVNSDATVGGFLKVGNNIKPKSGVSLGLDGHVNITKGLDITPYVHNGITDAALVAKGDSVVNGTSRVDGLTSLNGGLKVKGVSSFDGNLIPIDADGTLNILGGLNATGKATFTELVSAKLSLGGNLSNPGNSPLYLADDVEVTGNIKGDTIQSLTSGGSVNFSSPANLTKGATISSGNLSVKTGTVTAAKVGTWSLATNNVNLRSYPVGQMVAVSAGCPSGIPVSCQGSFSISVSSSDRYFGSKIITGTNKCEAYGQRDVASGKDAILVAQTLCFDSSK